MDIKKAHFIGIGGVGMSATAKLLRDSGVSVTGSDEEVYPPISTMLEQEHIAYASGYSASNIPADADVIVIGKNAKLVPENNEEVAAAYESVQKNLPAGRRVMSFPEVLAELSQDKQTIVVAGSYGKSTSTALLAHVLTSSGKDPSYLIGAVPAPPTGASGLSTPSSALGKGELFILEGDEYPASNTDPRSKFLLMHPQHLLLTPLAHDHFNIFPTPAEYLKPFYELLTLVPQGGTVAASTAGPLSQEFLQHAARPVVTYGVHEGDFTAANIVWGEHTTFTIMQAGKQLVDITMSQLGEHNIENIVGVAALLFTLGLVEPAAFAEAVASFKGIRRRLDKKSESTLVPIFEGFGSSYDKLKSAIAAMKQHFPAKRLVVVFEPNTIGWRSRATLSQYDDVFAGSSMVYIFNPPHDGKETQLSTEEIASHVRAHSTPAAAVSTPEQMLEMLEQDMDANDAILLSSSGAMGGLIESIPHLAERKFPL